MLIFIFFSTKQQKSDSIAKLYDMDENPERKVWLDKLISFMEERRTPITACPTISKQALDLYRLYLFVKERGGFVEVCKVSSKFFAITVTCIYIEDMFFRLVYFKSFLFYIICINIYSKIILINQ